MKIFITVIICLTWVNGIAQNTSVSANIVTQTATGGQKLTTKSEAYYNSLSGKLIQNFSEPVNYIIITNSKGEGLSYFPEQNKVTGNSGELMNSEFSILGIFINKKTQDMGLSELGFGLKDVKYEGEYEVSIWETISTFNTNDHAGVSKIKLVHKDFKPVFMEYFDIQNNVIKKIYYNNYTLLSSYSIPQKITEINYTSKNDSILSRTSLSNIHFIDDTHPMLNFKVPEDAKIVN